MDSDSIKRYLLRLRKLCCLHCVVPLWTEKKRAIEGMLFPLQLWEFAGEKKEKERSGILTCISLTLYQMSRCLCHVV